MNSAEKSNARLVAELEEMTGRVRDLERALAEQDRLERQRQVSEELQRLIADNLPVLIGYIDAEERFRFVNKTYEIWLNRPRSQIIGKTVAEVLPKTHYEVIRPLIAAALSGEGSRDEAAVDYADGKKRHALRSFIPHFSDSKQVRGVFILVQDLSERRQAEVALAKSEARFRTLYDANPAMMVFSDFSTGRYLEVNDLFVEKLGYGRDELIGNTVHELGTWVDIQERDRLATLTRTSGGAREFEAKLRAKAGDVLDCILATTVLELEGEQRLLTFVQDISERRQAEDALRASEEQLRLVTDSLPQLFAYLDRSERYLFVNKACEDWYGLSKAEIVGQHAKDLHAEASYEKIRHHINQVLAGEQLSFENTIEYPDGTARTVRVTYVPHFDDAKEVKGFVALSEDVTEQKSAEALVQKAQKMEAIGQLTGGVAHDFNNLLAVIMGNADLLSDELGSHNGFIQAIDRAAMRGADLTQRLLAYSRQQPLQPRPTDLAALVEGMMGLLRRTLGETIEVATVSAGDLAHVMADPGQVEDALLNLALNARDAMPAGGKLTVECANARLDEAYVARNPEAVAGDYVVLAVSDTGVGMSAEVLAHAFEPFFTTKGVGQGSGLGLSMVYGFAKQSGGHVVIYSEEGLGTTVKLYLLPAESAAQPIERRQAADIPKGHGETILLIEDDEDVRALGRAMLESLGYYVIEVADAADARSALERVDQVDLVLSDVVLPGGTSGPEFAEQTRNERPDLKIIFMSGYPAEAAKRNGFLSSDSVLLNKPFERRQLAEALREALN